MSQLNATSAKISTATGIDGALVIVVIQAVVNLISVCMAEPTPEEVARAAKHPRWRHRNAMRNAVWRELDARGEGRRLDLVMAALQLEIADMTTEQIAEVCQECAGGITADYN